MHNGNYGSCSSYMKILRTTYSIPCVHNWASLVAQMVKNLPAGDLGLIPGSGRSSGEGNGYLLQYSCLENSMDRGAWWATMYIIMKLWLQEKGHGLGASNQRI